ncbi:MAG: calcium-binding protein, partial [Candidatus Poribacteria bacterium]|nr:calcium-binding protein [Candidatus Poribacteria bacterium]
VHDTQTGTTTRVSLDSSGAQATGDSSSPSISSSGRYITFESNATNLSMTTVALTAGSTDGGVTHDGIIGTSVADAAGNTPPANWATGDPYVTVAADSNSSTDIFVRDTQTGTTTRVSLDSSGTQAVGGDSSSPSISSSEDPLLDGRYVTFESAATNLVVTTVALTAGSTDGGVTHDDIIGTSAADNAGNTPPAGGNDPINWEAGDTYATVAVDTNGSIDIFVHDTQTGTTTRVSLDSSGAQAAGDS